MKQAIKIFVLVYCIILLGLIATAQNNLVEVIPDSVYFQADIVDKGKFEVYQGIELISTHSKSDKAKLKAASIKALFPNDSIYVKAPNSEPTAKLKVFLNEAKLNVLNDDLINRIVILENRTDIQGETIEHLLADVNYIRTRDSLQIATLERRIESLQTFIKDSIYFSMEQPIDYSLPIIKGFSHDTTGWLIDEEEQSFTYQNELDHRYIVFDFNRELEIGETYELTFDIITNGNANFDIWFYPKDEDTLPDNWVSGRVTETIVQEEGTYRLFYKVEDINRNSLGIRARLNDLFILSNVKIIKSN